MLATRSSTIGHRTHGSGSLWRSVPISVGVFAILFSLCVLLIWISGSDELRAIVSSRMKVNSALGCLLIASGILVWLWGEAPRPGSRRLLAVRGIAGLALVVGGGTLIEYGAGVSLGIDELFIRDQVALGQASFPGRMALNAAICLSLLGLALFGRTLGEEHPLRRHSAKGLVLNLLICLGVLFGYLYNAHDFYQFASFLRMSPYTAFADIWLAVAIFCLDPRSSEMRNLFGPGRGSQVARWLLPPALILPALLGRFRLWLQNENVVSPEESMAFVSVLMIVMFASIVWAAARSLNAGGDREALAQAETEIERERLSASLATLRSIHQVSKQVSGELDMEKLVQNVTDAATRLSHAQLGAFFYNVVSEKGESYVLYAISGVPREAFSKFPMPRNTEVFAPTFAGKGVVRSADIRKDPRYGKNDPYFGMPVGHLPVASYLAVSVVSRSGEVLGGLFFGHEQRGVFTEREEELVVGLASQTAIAMDNARLYERAQKAIQTRDEFLSVASHELKTPLTSLSLQAQLRLRQLAKNPEGAISADKWKALLEGDLRQFKRVNRLIEDMLDIGRISAGKMSVEPEETDLTVLAGNVIERLKPQYEAAGCQVDLKTEPEAFAEVDGFRLEQVLVNMLSNAFKYGAGRPIEVEVRKAAEGVELLVRDQGRGIAPEDARRIFRRFERAVPGKEISGLGLGLYIADQIVAAHSGRISVDSGLGKGALFRVWVPRHFVAS